MNNTIDTFTPSRQKRSQVDRVRPTAILMRGRAVGIDKTMKRLKNNDAPPNNDVVVHLATRPRRQRQGPRIENREPVVEMSLEVGIPTP